MKEFGRVRWFHCTYKEFLERKDELEKGTLIFCEDTGKLFVKTGDKEVIDMSNPIEIE